MPGQVVQLMMDLVGRHTLGLVGPATMDLADLSIPDLVDRHTMALADLHILDPVVQGMTGPGDPLTLGLADHATQVREDHVTPVQVGPGKAVRQSASEDRKITCATPD